MQRWSNAQLPHHLLQMLGVDRSASQVELNHKTLLQPLTIILLLQQLDKPTCMQADIKKAYYKLALQWHPDRNKSSVMRVQSSTPTAAVAATPPPAAAQEEVRCAFQGGTVMLKTFTYAMNAFSCWKHVLPLQVPESVFVSATGCHCKVPSAAADP
jgi:hypothetical protein